MGIKHLLLVLLVLLVPMTIFVKWHRLNIAYPTNDESRYFELSQEFYLNFKEESASKALSEMYWHKHWKPILHPLLLVPILAATDGNVRLSIDIFDAIFYSLLVAAIYLFLRRHLEEGMSVLGAVCISLLSWVYGMSTTFNSEIAFAAGTICLFSYFHDQKYFQNLKKCVIGSLLLVFVFCCRPVEIILLATIGLIFFICEAYRKQFVRPRDLLCVFLMASFFLTISLLPFFCLHRLWTKTEVAALLSVVLISFCYVWLKALKLNLNRNFHIFFGLFFLLACFWFAPGAKTLMDWIFVANFDYLAKETGNRMNTSLFSFLVFYVQKIGLLPVILSGILCFDRRKNLRSLFSVKSLVVFSGFIAFPLLGGILSFNGDVRYYYSGWIIIIMVLFAQVFRRDRPAYWLRCTFLASLVALLVFQLLMQMNGINLPYPLSRLQLLSGESFFLLRPTTEEAHVQIQRELASELTRLNRTNTNVLILQTSSNTFLDSATLNIISREHGEEFHFENISHYYPMKLNDAYNLFSHQYRFIIAGPAETSFKNLAVAPGIIANELVTACSSHADPKNPELKDFRFVRTFSFNESQNKFGVHCLFENVNLKEKNMPRFH